MRCGSPWTAPTCPGWSPSLPTPPSRLSQVRRHRHGAEAHGQRGVSWASLIGQRNPTKARQTCPPLSLCALSSHVTPAHMCACVCVCVCMYLSLYLSVDVHVHVHVGDQACRALPTMCRMWPRTLRRCWRLRQSVCRWHTSPPRPSISSRRQGCACSLWMPKHVSCAPLAMPCGAHTPALALAQAQARTDDRRSSLIVTKQECCRARPRVCLAGLQSITSRGASAPVRSSLSLPPVSSHTDTHTHTHTHTLPLTHSHSHRANAWVPRC
jgi:hypothetical protein